jgi:hypothetical protein
MQLATNPKSLWLKYRPSRNGAKFGSCKSTQQAHRSLAFLTEDVEKINSSLVVRDEKGKP